MTRENAFPSSSTARPSLPPLHALRLPGPLSEGSGTACEDHDLSIPSRTSINNLDWRRTRRSSISSLDSSPTSIDTSREASPSSDCDIPLTPSTEAISSNAFRLVLTTFDKANAFVVVPPSPPYVPNISALSRMSKSRTKPKRSQALLLVGPAADHLRHPRLRIAKGTRVHPYRMFSSSGKPSLTLPAISSAVMQL